MKKGEGLDVGAAHSVRRAHPSVPPGPVRVGQKTTLRSYWTTSIFTAAPNHQQPVSSSDLVPRGRPQLAKASPRIAGSDTRRRFRRLSCVASLISPTSDAAGNNPAGPVPTGKGHTETSLRLTQFFLLASI